MATTQEIKGDGYTAKLTGTKLIVTVPNIGKSVGTTSTGKNEHAALSHGFTEIAPGTRMNFDVIFKAS
jgi:hypothetical protein